MKFKIENIEELSNSREMLDMKPNKFIRTFIYILILTIVILLLWAWFTEKEVVVKVSGIVSPKEDVYTISNQIPGVLKAVYLEEGKHINEGDLLYTIDDTDMQNKKNELENDKESLKNKLNNLNKLAKSVEEDTNYFTTSDEEKEYYYKYESYSSGSNITNDNANKLLMSKEDLKLKLNGLLCLQKSINDNTDYNSPDSIYSIQYNNYQLEKKQLEETIRKQEEYKNEIINKREIQSEESSETSGEVTSGTSSEILALETEIENNKKNLTKLFNDTQLQIQNSIDELNLKITDIDNTINANNQNSTLSKEKNKTSILADIQSQITLVSSDLKKLDFNLDELNSNIERCQVKSEYTGKVDLKNTLQSGSILESGTIICNIIPLNEEYKIDLIIDEKDVVYLKEGQEIKYNFRSLPYSEYGFLTGEIQNISTTSKLNSDSGIVYYTGVGSLENNNLNSKDGEKLQIKPGMSCDSRIIVRKTRTLIYYLQELNFILKS